MPNLPATMINTWEVFAPHFGRERTWEKAKELVVGTLLVNGRRTVAAALRVMGLHHAAHYNQYHHVLSRAVWSPLAVARTLLGMLIATLVPAGTPLVFGIDETIERRWGAKIAARGIYRDAVRSSQSHLVKASGLRWVCLMLLTPISWAQRVWALPILTVLSPSERYYEERGREPKTLLERVGQMVKLLRRWLPDQKIVLVGDNSYAALDFLSLCQGLNLTVVTRFRLDAALYDPAPAYSGRGRPRKKGTRQPTLTQCLKDEQTVWERVTLQWYNGQDRDMDIATATAVWFHNGKPPVPIRWVLIRDPQGKYDDLALLSTHPDEQPFDIITWFIQRWCVEVTFEEARRHLGVETQRQWADQAIARTTPALLGLFSWVTLLAHRLQSDTTGLPLRPSAWYSKSQPTFADALAWVRNELWEAQHTFPMSASQPDMLKIPRAYLNALLDAACYAA